MKIGNVDVCAYMALSSAFKIEEDSKICDDLKSKMNIHSRKIMSDNPNVKIKW